MWCLCFFGFCFVVDCGSTSSGILCLRFLSSLSSPLANLSFFFLRCSRSSEGELFASIYIIESFVTFCFTTPARRQARRNISSFIHAKIRASESIDNRALSPCGLEKEHLFLCFRQHPRLEHVQHRVLSRRDWMASSIFSYAGWTFLPGVSSMLNGPKREHRNFCKRTTFEQRLT